MLTRRDFLRSAGGVTALVLTPIEKGLYAVPDFNLGWQCTVQGNWIQEQQPAA